MTRRPKVSAVRIGVTTAINTTNAEEKGSKICWLEGSAVTWLTVLVLALGLALLAVSILYFNSPTIDNICRSHECLRMATSLKISMDTSVDPCEDFYNFTCGNWRETHPPECSSDVSEEYYSWENVIRTDILRIIIELLETNTPKSNYNPMPIKMSKILYSSCMNTNRWNSLGFLPLEMLLRNLELPLYDFSTISNETSQFISSWAAVRMTMDLNVFVHLGVQGDDLFLEPPDRFEKSFLETVPERYSEEKKNYKLRNISGNNTINSIKEDTRHKKFVLDVVSYVLSNGAKHHKLPTNNLQSQINKITKIIQKIEKAVSSIDRHNDADFMTSHELQDLCNRFAKQKKISPKQIWTSFISNFAIDSAKNDSETKIIVHDREYLKRIFLLISSISDADLITYLWWTIVKQSIPYLTEPLQKLHKDFHQSDELRGCCTRDCFCGRVVSQLMDKAVLNLYLNNYLISPIMTKNEIYDMFLDIKLTFNSTIKSYSWLDEQTKKAVYSKLENEAAFIGFPPWVLDKEKLESYYEGVNISSHSFLTNAVQIIKQNTERKFFGDKPSYFEKWSGSLLEVNAAYQLDHNIIILSSGFIKFPYFENGLKVFKYASIGAAIGHEIIHGFDTDGINYVANGDPDSACWSTESRRNFLRIVECFVDKYGKYYEPRVNRRVDGNLTKNENIADNGGTNLAFKAYQTWNEKYGPEPSLPGFSHYTGEQMFFLAFAHTFCSSSNEKGLGKILDDDHPPHHVRVTEVLRNSKDFSESWNCSAGSRMNPQVKCSLW